MATVSRDCPHCTSRIVLPEGAKSVVCVRCGEQVHHDQFPDDSNPSLDIELENAKSLRAIAMGVQILAASDVLRFEGEYPDGDQSVVLAKLEAAKVEPFED